MSKDKKTRYLKIQTRKQKSRWVIGGKKVPEIRISGIWLAREGFYPKDKIKVEIRKEFLGIELQPHLT